MGDIENLKNCLKLIKTQGFEAEHTLLVQLFVCIEAYWNEKEKHNVEAYWTTKGEEIFENPVDASKTVVEMDKINDKIINITYKADTKDVEGVGLFTGGEDDFGEIGEGNTEDGEIEDDLRENPREKVEGSKVQKPSKRKKRYTLASWLEESRKKKAGLEENIEEKLRKSTQKRKGKISNSTDNKREEGEIKTEKNEDEEKTETAVDEAEMPTHLTSKFDQDQVTAHGKDEVDTKCDGDEIEDLEDGMKEKSHVFIIGHKITIGTDGRFQCPHEGCDKNFIYRKAIKRHMLTVHDMPVLPKRKNVRSRAKPSEKKVFTYKREHTAVNTEAVSTDCKYCSFKLPLEYGFRSRLRMHYKTEHFVCQICHKKHEDAGELGEHMKSLHEDNTGRLICGVDGCERSFNGLATVVDHVRYFHKKIADRICLECGKPYLKSLKSHRRQHGVEPSSLKSCKQCGYTCVNISNLIIHVRSKHPKPGQPTRKFSCSSCDFETSGLSQDEEFKLIMHKTIHQAGEIICTMCPYKTEKRFSVKRHLAEVHGIGQVFQCNQCDYKTGGASGRGHLKLHMMRHNQEKNFLCDQCEFGTYEKTRLKEHYNNRHGSDPPKYSCNECDYKSNDKGNFKAHQEVRHGSVILSCEECDYKTKSKRGLREHKRKHSANFLQDRMELI